MQKKLVALAIAALGCGTALAQSNVTVYGTIDMGYMWRGGENGAAPKLDYKNDIQGLSDQSHIGFKGAEDLGNGTKAIFDLQYRVAGDVNTGLAQAGHSYVGLTGGWGTVVGGYLDGLRYGIYGKYTPTGNYSVGNFASMTAQYDRAANAVAYISPAFHGFTLILAHATNTLAQEGAFSTTRKTNGTGNDGDDRLFSVNLVYNKGPLSIDVDYETTKAVRITDAQEYVFTTGASYDFGVAKVSALYDVIKGDPNSVLGGGAAGFNLGNTAGTESQEYSRRNWLVGVTVPFGRTKVLASFGQVQDKILKNADADKWSIGARYSLSKRTELYTDYAYIDNERNAAYMINPMGNNAGTSNGVHGFDMGIRHTF